jgi:hypothetical protein
MAVRKPLGVAAGITPWNGAHNLAWRTALLPMPFGNTMVLKPSEERRLRPVLFSPRSCTRPHFLTDRHHQRFARKGDVP